MNTFPITFVDATGKPVTYDTPAVSPFEMAMFAIEYMAFLHRGNPVSSYEDFVARDEHANRFADFCVAETLGEDGVCDPRINFREAHGRFEA